MQEDRAGWEEFLSSWQTQEFQGSVVFGAEGTNSVVAKKTGLNPKWSPEKVALVFSHESKISPQVLDEYYTERRKAYFHMGFKNTLGYGWIFPKKEHINIGFGAVLKDNQNSRKNYFEYVDHCIEQGLVPPIEKTQFSAALLPMAGPLKKTFLNRVLLLGDSAGFVNPTNGEGLHYAIKSGIIAAEVTKNIIADDDFREKRFSEYQKLWKNDFGRDLKMYLLAQKFLVSKMNRFLHYASKNEDFGRLLVRVSMSIESPVEKKWELVRRYLALRIRDLLGKL